MTEVVSRVSARSASVLAVGVIFSVTIACGTDDQNESSPSALDDDAITVGSFDFAESELLGELYGQALEAGGFEVEHVARLGPREFVAPALASGLLELVPEYAGTALQFMSAGSGVSTFDEVVTHDALVETLRERPLIALAAAPAQDANGLVVTKATAARYDLEDISDLIAIAPELTFGGPPECESRPFCLPAWQRVYGLLFGSVVRLDSGGPLTRQALEDGHVDVALLFTTDPSIGDFVLLDDDRGVQPAENVTPLVRAEVVERWGSEVVDLLDAVSAELTTAELRSLNAAMASGQTSARRVAIGWLRARGLR